MANNWHTCETCGAKSNGDWNAQSHRDTAHPEEARQRHIARITQLVRELTDQLEVQRGHLAYLEAGHTVAEWEAHIMEERVKRIVAQYRKDEEEQIAAEAKVAEGVRA